ncbi:PilZ domain-containing protein [Sedimenticola hydrogenitrophicus]|uniref:PilZ domain-containing protein n=1 Tax=Sedimenticola hydrogenitrophicus TaxID=2967975 RepID=UPI0021A5C2AE
MRNRQADHDSRGLTFQGTMLLNWETRTDDVASDRPAEDEKNERLLRTLLFSQDLHHEHGDESGDRMVADLARVEAKLDLLLDMVSDLLRQEQSPAVATPVELWLNGASWTSGTDRLPELGGRLWLSLYIDSRLAQPLRLPARVTDVAGIAESFRVTVAFEVLDEPVQDLLAKLIFRQHRRMIAQQKADKRSE